MFDKVNLKKIQAAVVDGKFTFMLKLDGEKANIACGKLRRQHSNMAKDGFSFNEETDVLSYQPISDDFPLELELVRKLFEKVVKK